MDIGGMYGHFLLCENVTKGIPLELASSTTAEGNTHIQNISHSEVLIRQTMYEGLQIELYYYLHNSFPQCFKYFLHFLHFQILTPPYSSSSLKNYTK